MQTALITIHIIIILFNISASMGLSAMYKTAIANQISNAEHRLPSEYDHRLHNDNNDSNNTNNFASNTDQLTSLNVSELNAPVYQSIFTRNNRHNQSNLKNQHHRHHHQYKSSHAPWKNRKHRYHHHHHHHRDRLSGKTENIDEKRINSGRHTTIHSSSALIDNDIDNYNEKIKVKRSSRHIDEHEADRIKKILENFKDNVGPWRIDKHGYNSNNAFIINGTTLKYDYDDYYVNYDERTIEGGQQLHLHLNEILNINDDNNDDRQQSNAANDYVKEISSLYNTDNGVLKCPKCSGSAEHQNKVHVSQQQLNELRIDFVKRQILEKLRLKDPPQVTAVDYLPQPIIQMDEYNAMKTKENLDDYYARTSKKFIILEREYNQCAFINKNPAICFSLKIEDVDTDIMDVNQAVLWVYNKPNANDQMKQTLVVSEFEQQMSTKYLPKIKPIAIKSVDVVEGWIKINIAWPIKKWVGTHELSHLIHITCNSCELDSKDGGVIALEKEYQPFIVIDTQHRRQRSRQKRSVNCSAGVKECCREKLYISFKEIGWGDWIISPTGYNAYFCRGSCNSIASIASSNNHHSLIIKTLKDKYDRPLELIPCCTAKQFSQLELLFRDSNNTITQKFLPNMIVESCGCM